MFRVIISSNFKINGHNLARFQNSLKNSFGMLGYILFMRWIFFLEFSENNGKSGKDYKPQVGICFTCRMNCLILPHFLQNSWKNAKNRDKDWIWQVRMYSIDRMSTQILPRFSRIDSTNGKSGWRLIMKS